MTILKIYCLIVMFASLKETLEIAIKRKNKAMVITAIAIIIPTIAFLLLN